jgi:predicted TIM-barrel fold metal-dependent hydrolase
MKKGRLKGSGKKQLKSFHNYIIDFHSHFYKIEKAEEKLIEIIKKMNYVKIIISGIEGTYLEYIYGNNEVLELYKKYPEIIIPFAHFRLGIDKINKIEEFLRMGFKGLKFIFPLKNYDDEEYFPVYEKMEKENLIGIFHTGIVSRKGAENKKENISSGRMRPVFLDTIARNFPELSIIGAHLGYPWYEEAVEVARVNPNVYFDISGPCIYSRSQLYFKEIFWHKNKFLKRSIIDKLIFGSDIYYQNIPNFVKDLKNFFRKIDAEENIEDFFYNTGKKILERGGLWK